MEPMGLQETMEQILLELRQNRLSYSRGLLRSDAVILCMLVIGLVGILMDKLLTALFRRLLPWQKKA